METSKASGQATAASRNLRQVMLVPLFPVSIVTSADLAVLIGFGVPALLIVILTRGRLGYQPGQEQPLRPGEIEAQPTL